MLEPSVAGSVDRQVWLQGSAVCRQLVGQISGIVPPGIGNWPPTWDIVASADTDFTMALAAWQAEPTSEDALEEVLAAYGAVIRRWRDAVAEYRREVMSASAPPTT